MEDKQMLLQIAVEQQRMIRELCRNDLLLIESFLYGPDVREALASAARTVRETLRSVDVLGDKILEADAKILHR